MKLDSILLGTTIDQITSSQALNLATLLSWLVNNETELEHSDYEIFTSREPEWSFIAKPADDSSLCFAVTACGRFVLPVVLCACCNQHVFDDEVRFYDHLGSQQLCNACASGG
jgi:hypothetical protein